jgi:DNA-binding GntR family transcriptional regulator
MTGDVLRLTELPPLRRDQVIERLRNAIIAGHFRPGDRLIERELCERMGVSRTSIREALRHLEAENLIQVEPRRGPVVSRVTRKQVAEIYEVRALLEAALVRRFAETASENDIAELRRIYGDLRSARATGEVPRIVAQTTRFTEHMMGAVEHELIGDMLRKLAARISVVRTLAIAVPGRLEESGRELAVVMDAIERRDGELAARSLTTYVQNAGEAALRRFDENEQAESGGRSSSRSALLSTSKSGVARK